MQLPRPDLPRIEPRFLVPAALGCVTLFSGGIALGAVIGSPPATTTTQTYTTSLTRKGTVITVNGQKKVRLPARTITRKGRAVTIPAQTVDLTQTRVVNGTAVVTTRVPTTITRTQTNTQLVTQTITTTVQLPPTSIVSVITTTVTTTVTT